MNLEKAGSKRKEQTPITAWVLTKDLNKLRKANVVVSAIVRDAIKEAAKKV